MSTLDTQAWVREARRGDVAAFECLYCAYVDRIYGLCLRMTGNRGDAEDCTQNAFISAWRKLDQFRASSRFGTWLYRIAVNEVLMAQRRRRDECNGVVERDRPAADAAPDVGLDLEAAIAELPAQARHVFVLRAIYGHSHDEVATLLDIAPGTARAHFFRARDLLQRTLRLEDDHDPK